jgi:ELWxxDGT repeat protein
MPPLQSEAFAVRACAGETWAALTQSKGAPVPRGVAKPEVMPIENGRELRIADGTEPGTNLLLDIAPGAEDANISELVRSGSMVYFTAFNGSESVLFRTDDTAAGTRCAHASSFDTVTLPVVSASGVVVFGGYNSASGEEIRATFNGAELAIVGGDLSPGIASSAPQNLLVAVDTIFFQANNGAIGAELYKLQLTGIEQLSKSGFE